VTILSTIGSNGQGITITIKVGSDGATLQAPTSWWLKRIAEIAKDGYRRNMKGGAT
jgi:hypothetical protein